MIETPINVHPANGEVIDHNQKNDKGNFSFKIKGDKISFIEGEMYDCVLNFKCYDWTCSSHDFLSNSLTYNNDTVYTNPIGGMTDSDYGKEFKYRYKIYQQYPNLYTNSNGELKKSTLLAKKDEDTYSYYYGGFVEKINSYTGNDIPYGIAYIFKINKIETVKQDVYINGVLKSKDIYKITIDMPKNYFDYIDTFYLSDYAENKEGYSSNSKYWSNTYIYDYKKELNSDKTAYVPIKMNDLQSTGNIILGYSKSMQCLYTTKSLTVNSTGAICMRMYTPMADIYYGSGYIDWANYRRSGNNDRGLNTTEEYPNRIYLPNPIVNFKEPNKKNTVFNNEYDRKTAYGGMFIKIGYETRLIINAGYDEDKSSNGVNRDYIELDLPFQTDTITQLKNNFNWSDKTPFQIYTNYIQTGWYNFKDRHEIELSTTYTKGKYGLVCKGSYSQKEGASLKCYDFSISNYTVLNNYERDIEFPADSYYTPIDDKYGVLYISNFPIQGSIDYKDFTKKIGLITLFTDEENETGCNVYGYNKGFVYIDGQNLINDDGTFDETDGKIISYGYQLKITAPTPILSTPQIYSYNIEQELIIPTTDRDYSIDFNVSTQDNQRGSSNKKWRYAGMTEYPPYYDYYKYDTYGNIIGTNTESYLSITPVVDNENKVVTLKGKNNEHRKINVFRVDKENNYHYVGRIEGEIISLNDYTVGNKSDVYYYFESGNVNEYICYQRSAGKEGEYAALDPLTVATDWNGWCISSLSYFKTIANKKVYNVKDTWHFLSNINSDNITTNFNTQIHQNTSYYSQTSRNDNKYESGTFTADLLKIDCPTMQIIDDIQRVNAWKKFLLENDTFLLKSHKGDVWIVAISANPTRSYENNLYNTTNISYQWIEIENVEDVIIKSESDII